MGQKSAVAHFVAQKLFEVEAAVEVAEAVAAVVGVLGVVGVGVWVVVGAAEVFEGVLGEGLLALVGVH